MKTNGDMLHGGKLKPEFRQAWANYYTKFIKAYEREGIPIWGITVQNEPMATQTWESCIYTAEDERDFLKNFLGPTMKREGLGDKKIIAWDHNRDLIYQRVSTILADPEAAQYVWGIGLPLVRAVERRRDDVRQRQARARDLPEQELLSSPKAPPNRSRPEEDRATGG